MKTTQNEDRVDRERKRHKTKGKETKDFTIRRGKKREREKKTIRTSGQNKKANCQKKKPAPVQVLRDVQNAAKHDRL